MSDKIIELIKQASDNCIKAGKPVEFTSGTVISENPLTIMTEQKLQLTENFITLTSAVKDRYADMEITTATQAIPDHTHDVITNTLVNSEHSHNINSVTEYAGSHSHDITGIKRIKLLNGLKKGEKVLLARWQGGQRYIVLDRISDNICSGEWL